MEKVCLSQYPDHPLFKRLCRVGTGLVYHIEPKPGVSNSTGYVGITKTSIKKRLSSHLAPSSKCVALRNAINKHGRKHFTIRVVENNVLRENLLQREIDWVCILDTRVNGYNCTDGGESNPMDYPEVRQRHKQKMSDKDFVAKTLAKRMKTFATEEFKERKKSAHQNAWDSGGDEMKQRHSKSMKTAWESRDKGELSVFMKEQWLKDGERERRRSLMKKSNQEPERKLAKSSVSSKRWQDPIYREKREKTIVAKAEARFALLPPEKRESARKQWQKQREAGRRYDKKRAAARRVVPEDDNFASHGQCETSAEDGNAAQQRALLGKVCIGLRRVHTGR